MVVDLDDIGRKGFAGIIALRDFDDVGDLEGDHGDVVDVIEHVREERGRALGQLGVTHRAAE